MLVVWMISSNYPFNKSIFLKEIKMQYSGRIDSIYTNRSITLKIYTVKDSVVIVSGLSEALLELAGLGDSIEKILNKNCCVIKRNGSSDTCQYIHVGEQYDFVESVGEYWNECERR